MNLSLPSVVEQIPGYTDFWNNHSSKEHMLVIISIISILSSSWRNSPTFSFFHVCDYYNYFMSATNMDTYTTM